MSLLRRFGLHYRLVFFAEAATKSRSNGRFVLLLKPGSYTISVRKDGFLPAVYHVHIGAALGVQRVDVALSPTLQDSEVRFIFSWQEPSLALKSYLSTPTVDGHECLVSSEAKRCETADDGLALFEYQSSTGYGPQTIAVRRWSSGDYTLLLMRSGGRGNLRSARVAVRVYVGSKSYTHRLGSYGRIVGIDGHQPAWCVLRINGAAMRQGDHTAAVQDCADVSLAAAEAAVRRVDKAVRTADLELARGMLTTAAQPPSDGDGSHGDLSGAVINVVDGRPLQLALVVVTYPRGRVSDIVSVTRSDARGRYKVMLPYGEYTIHADLNGFVSATEDVSLTAPHTTKALMLSPKLAAGEIRFVLTWRGSPADIDGHLATPDGCDVWYRQKSCNGESGRAQLDVDNTVGHGPETITLHQCSSGDFFYFVKQYSRRGSMHLSGAIVRAFLPDGRTIVHRVGRAGKITGERGRGRTWAVFKYSCKTGKFTDARNLSDSSIRRLTRGKDRGKDKD